MKQIQLDAVDKSNAVSKQEHAKWYFARTIFFGGRVGVDRCSVADGSAQACGLALARQCEHPDARFLVSLFEKSGPPKTQHEAVSVFLENDSDARSLCWAAVCGESDRRQRLDLIARSAVAGCGWAQYMVGVISNGTSNKINWLHKAKENGEIDALFALSSVKATKTLTARNLASCSKKRAVSVTPRLSASTPESTALRDHGSSLHGCINRQSGCRPVGSGSD